MDLTTKTPGKPGRPEPSAVNGKATEPTWACSKCGTTDAPDESGRCPTATCRAFRVGNPGPEVAGHRSRDFWQANAARLADYRNEFLADAGFPPDVRAPLALRVCADALAQSIFVRDTAFERMQRSGGPLQESGKPRRAFTVWQSASEQLIRDLRSALGELATLAKSRPAAAAPSTELIVRRIIVRPDGTECDVRDYSPPESVAPDATPPPTQGTEAHERDV